MHAHLYAIAQTVFGCSITLGLTRLEMRWAASLLVLIFASLIARVPQILHACTVICVLYRPGVCNLVAEYHIGL